MRATRQLVLLPPNRVWRTYRGGATPDRIAGGFPHALGEGVFMVEVQGPTDFAVRCEFDRAGYVLRRYEKFFCPAGLGAVRFEPEPTATLLECYPPA